MYNQFDYMYMKTLCIVKEYLKVLIFIKLEMTKFCRFPFELLSPQTWLLKKSFSEGKNFPTFYQKLLNL